jgi:hypothetical protein
LGFSASGRPTYENRVFRKLLILRAKPNKSFAPIFVQPQTDKIRRIIRILFVSSGNKEENRINPEDPVKNKENIIESIHLT